MSALDCSPSADRNLLFGILALQMDFIGRDDLIGALNAWVLDKATPLGRILVERHALTAEEHDKLDELVRLHIRKHGGDVQKSLGAVQPVGPVREQLQALKDEELHASLAHVASDPFATCPPAVGESTSAGLRFRVLRPLGEGNLGEVFVALDTELHREVALKHIQEYHADNPGSRAHFLHEAEITGGLEHPGIVPVYGLGKYPDGRPYYAMRYVLGDDLQKAIASFHQAEKPGRETGERALALRQLLRRFVDVCNAVAYAHSRGVLHRDLKPSNVMLGPYGETLVIDWGVAKPFGKRLTDEDGTASQSPLWPPSSARAAPTQIGTIIGTPAYMPPEQAAGRLDQLGPASDVYSLGAILYCLLTGRAPFAGDQVTDVLRRVQAGDFPRPREVKREVPAALEAVCLKAMALRPQDRYPTARSLAADVERWLADEAVSAWREPWRLRTARWARRHKALVAAAAAGFLVAVLAAGSAAWWLDRQRTEQRRGIESALAEVKRLQEQNRWSEARAVLKQARDRLGQGGPQDLRQRLDQGERHLDLVARLEAIRLQRGIQFEEQGNFVRGDREYEEAFRDAGMTEVQGDVEAAVAWVRDSEVRDSLLAALDDWAICAENRQRQQWLLSVTRAADPVPWRARLRDPAVWGNKAALLRVLEERDLHQLSPQLLVALSDQLSKLGHDPMPLLRAAHQRYPGDFWVIYALAQRSTGELNAAGATNYFLAALAIRPDVPLLRSIYGLRLATSGRPEEGVVMCRKAAELDPKNATTHVCLGRALAGTGRRQEAIVELRQAIALKPQDTEIHYLVSLILINMGLHEEAVATCRKAVEILPDSRWHARLGLLLFRAGRPDDAMAEYQKAIEVGPNAVEYCRGGAGLLLWWGRAKEAVALYRKVIELDPKNALMYGFLSLALRQLWQWEEAIAMSRRAIELEPKSAWSHEGLAQALSQAGRFAEAMDEGRIAAKLAPGNQSMRNNLTYYESMLALDKKLPAILNGEIKPANTDEQLRLAVLCRIRRYHVAATRFFVAAFTADPRLAIDLDAGNRYRAASSALLSAAGHGEGVWELDVRERDGLRRQALDWLRADLAALSQVLQKEDMRVRATARQRLLNWQQDADLAAVRDAAALEKLPEAERADWRKLWNDVAALVNK